MHHSNALAIGPLLEEMMPDAASMQLYTCLKSLMLRLQPLLPTSEESEFVQTNGRSSSF